MTAAGQTPAPAVRPDYQVVRYSENWGVLRTSAAPARFDGLKYLPLSDSGSVYLSLGGQLRSRAEVVRNFMLTEAPSHEDSFGLLRALLHADLQATPHLRVFVEGKHAMAFSRDLPGGKRPLDQDEWELQNAFADVACCVGGDVGVTARIGRQELLLGGQRLISPLDWSNTRRTFEGVRLMARINALMLDGFATRPVLIGRTAPNRRDPLTTFWGTAIRPRVAAPRFAWELYAFGLAQDETTQLFGQEGAHERITLGGRATGALGSAANRFDVEGGWQTGTLAEQEIAAWFIASELSRSFAAAPLRPVATIGFDYSSGDADPSDEVAGTFHQLYPLGHAYAGHMDLLGRQNLMEARGVLTATPVAALQARIAIHQFMRARTSDAAYNVGGGVLRSSPGGQRSIGTELNLTTGYRASRHTRIEVGYGHFRPGAFLKGSPSGAVASDWVYASTAFTF